MNLSKLVFVFLSAFLLSLAAAAAQAQPETSSNAQASAVASSPAPVPQAAAAPAPAPAPVAQQPVTATAIVTQPGTSQQASAQAHAVVPTTEATAPESSEPAGDSTKETTTNIQNNNITLGQPSVITVAPAGQTMTTPAASPQPSQQLAMKTDENEATLSAKAIEPASYDNRIQLTPMFGASGFIGDWYSHISNSYTLGLGLEVPVSELFSIEAEGGHGRYNISYGPPNGGAAYAHNFNQYNLGGNLKLYLTKKTIRPYVGAGLMGLYYENMSSGFSQMGPFRPYNQWVGAGQIIGGADIPIAQGVAVGARGAWIMPLFNRPYTLDNGSISAPGYEEAAAMNTSMFKALGTVSVAL